MIENEEEMPLMAVVVQGLIHSDISGVIFSENPVLGKTNEVMMTASYGLGEALYGHGVDIEFGMSDGIFYLLQARPITASFSNTTNDGAGAAFQMKPEELQDFWISMDDHMPGLTCPLFSSLIIPALKNGMKKNGEKYQVPDLNIKDIKLYRGQLYSSPSMPETAAEPEFDESLFELLPRLSERMYHILEQNLFPLYEKLDLQITQPLTMDDAINGFEELKEIYLKAYDDHFDIVIPQVILSAIIENILVTYTGDQTQVVLLHEMMTGVMNKSLETDQKLSHLAKDVLQDSELLQAFNDHSSTLIGILSGFQSLFIVLMGAGILGFLLSHRLKTKPTSHSSGHAA